MANHFVSMGACNQLVSMGMNATLQDVNNGHECPRPWKGVFRGHWARRPFGVVVVNPRPDGDNSAATWAAGHLAGRSRAQRGAAGRESSVFMSEPRAPATATPGRNRAPGTCARTRGRYRERLSFALGAAYCHRMLRVGAV